MQVTEEQLRTVLNRALVSDFPGSNLSGMEAVLSVHFLPRTSSAFIELRTPEMAAAALQLSGKVTLHRRVLNVNMPHHYSKLPLPPLAEQQQVRVWVFLGGAEHASAGASACVWACMRHCGRSVRESDRLFIRTLAMIPSHS